MSPPKKHIIKSRKGPKVWLIYILSAVFTIFLFNVSLFKGNPIAAFGWFFQKPILALISIILVMIAQLFIAAVINNHLISSIIITLTSVIICIANILRINFRGEPILPEDIYLLNSLVEIIMMVNIWILLIFIIILITAGAFIIYLYRSHREKFQVFPTTRNFLFRRLSIIALTFIMILSLRGFQHDNSWLSNFSQEYAGYIRVRNNEILNYQRNGFVFGFLSNLTGPPMRKPEGYSKAKIEKIVKKYESRAKYMNQKRKHEDLSDYNVIMILSESLANPQRIEGVTLNQNPIPYIQDSSDKCASGTLISPTYGGGTANAEFELLTGMSVQYLEPNMKLPYQRFIAEFEQFPTALKSHDASIALHAYNDKMFNRRNVYQTFGFDKVLFEDDFTYTEHLYESEYISDDSVYKEILKQLRTHDEPLMIHAITMQNHAGYAPKYKDQEHFVSESVDPSVTEALEVYTQGIHLTDLATERFIKQIDALETPTVVVFYGDHLPGIYGDLESDNSNKTMSETDFFIYSNVEGKTIDRPGTRSLNELIPMVKEVTNTQVTPFEALLTNYRDQIPASKNGEFYMEQEMRYYDDLTEKQRDALKEYVLIQYDMLAGKQYSKQMFTK